MSKTLGAETYVPINKGNVEWNRLELGKAKRYCDIVERASSVGNYVLICLWLLCPCPCFLNSKMKGIW